MHPTLFEFGNFKIYSYGVMVALGFLIAVYLASRQAQRVGIASQQIFDVGLYALLSGIVGARVLHVLLNFGYYINRPLEIIMINQGGLAFQGGLLTGIIGAWIFIKRNRMPLWKTADVIVPYLALGEAIGRIGCFLNGCCYGIPTYLPIGIKLPGHILRLHPTQLYSSIFLLATFIVLRKIYKKKRFDGLVFFSYLVIFSFGRFFLDFFRGDLRPVLFGLRISQLISMGIFFASLVSFISFVLLQKSREKGTSL
jgi:phosphatidylglycerol:prolipoprotein diacylglycerol transferase